jgi:hypothetical protein
MTGNSFSARVDSLVAQAEQWISRHDGDDFIGTFLLTDQLMTVISELRVEVDARLQANAEQYARQQSQCAVPGMSRQDTFTDALRALNKGPRTEPGHPSV